MSLNEYDKHQITPIGKTNWRNEGLMFGIKQQDRLRHLYCVGKTGVGKSTLLLNMAIADMEAGIGICVIDPHGDLSETLIDYVPKDRIADVIYVDASKGDPIAFNPLYNAHEDNLHLVVAGLMATFHNLWEKSWGPRMEYILRYALLSLITYPDATLLHIQPLLTSYGFREQVLSYVQETHIRNFWHNEFDKYPPTLKAEAISPVLNKTGLFHSIAPLRKILGQKKSDLDIASILNEGKILIVNLAKGKIGEDATSLLGGMLISAIQLAAIGRVEQQENDRSLYVLYVDEAHNFINHSISTILSEARKFKLALFLTHQYIDQVPEDIRKAIFGNIGTLISFQVGAEDAAYLVKEFNAVFSENDLVMLPKFTMYIKLSIDGVTSKPFSATTLPIQVPSVSWKDEIIERQKEYRQHNTQSNIDNTVQDTDEYRLF